MKKDRNTLELIAGIGKSEKKTRTGDKKRRPRKRREPINQGNLLNPDKIQYGNLPQDQGEIWLND